jgi:hypothetical protein
MTRPSRKTWKNRLVFWLPFAGIYVAGTLGLGWLIGSPFGITRWALGTAAILAVWAAGKWTSRQIERRLTRAARRTDPGRLRRLADRALSQWWSRP